MASVDDMTQTQLRNIEKKTGKSFAELTELIRASGLEKHNDILAMLKERFGLGYGDANMLTLKARGADGASIAAEKTARGEDPTDGWYAGPKAGLRPIHDAVLAEIAKLGSDVEHAPKKTYVSLRRKKQFAMVGPGTNTLVDVGLNLKGEPGTDRLQVMPAGGMCTHRVRVKSVEEVDAELLSWVARAYATAG